MRQDRDDVEYYSIQFEISNNSSIIRFDSKWKNTIRTALIITLRIIPTDFTDTYTSIHHHEWYTHDAHNCTMMSLLSTDAEMFTNARHITTQLRTINHWTQSRNKYRRTDGRTGRRGDDIVRNVVRDPSVVCSGAATVHPTACTYKLVGWARFNVPLDTV